MTPQNVFMNPLAEKMRREFGTALWDSMVRQDACAPVGRMALLSAASIGYQLALDDMVVTSRRSDPARSADTPCHADPAQEACSVHCPESQARSTDTAASATPRSP